MKRKVNCIREEWKRVYKIMRAISDSCEAYNVWADSYPDNARWASVNIGIDIQSMDGLPYVCSWNNIGGYHVIFRGRHFIVDYSDPLSIKVKEGANHNRMEWQNFARMVEQRVEINRKKQRLYQIIGTVSDDAIEHIYNSAVVWECWDNWCNN